MSATAVFGYATLNPVGADQGSADMTVGSSIGVALGKVNVFGEANLGAAAAIGVAPGEKNTFEYSGSADMIVSSSLGIVGMKRSKGLVFMTQAHVIGIDPGVPAGGYITIKQGESHGVYGAYINLNGAKNVEGRAELLAESEGFPYGSKYAISQGAFLQVYGIIQSEGIRAINPIRGGSARFSHVVTSVVEGRKLASGRVAMRVTSALRAGPIRVYPRVRKASLLHGPGRTLSEVYTVKQFDLEPSIEMVLIDESKPAGQQRVDLTAASQAIFVMKRRQQVVIQREMEITQDNLDPATHGQVELDWFEGDTDLTGSYTVEVDVIWADGRPQTFPVSGYLKLKVVRSLNPTVVT